MKTKKKTGFTLVEVLVSMAILAMVMTAVAFAFDGAVKNYQANQGIYETVNRARQALLRITADLRTASAVGRIGVDDPDNTQVSLVTSDGRDITYRFNAADETLYYDDNTSGSSYVLCQNVQAMTFDRTEADIERDNGSGGTMTLTAVRDVRIVITVTDDPGKVTQTLAAAALVRKNL